MEKIINYFAVATFTNDKRHQSESKRALIWSSDHAELQFIKIIFHRAQLNTDIEFEQLVFIVKSNN